MTESPIRLSPSGPIIGKGGSPGPGARLRLTEATSTMGGTLDIPTVPGVIGPGGFGTPAALVLTLDTRDLQLSIQRVKAEQAAAEAQLRLVQAGARVEDIRLTPACAILMAIVRLCWVLCRF